ncbi:hypothetical protein [Klebsiella pneumoniae]|uniref:hypothetical protein n=1 Tax=Klebsiella pneumoniae TaxID=573 RepID=UPI00294A11AF|nr:hypothetical protein [Klebsiella pneumoniae]MDV5727860.1 hypothetical protein [Klebsiella pneumoniae]
MNANWWQMQETSWKCKQASGSKQPQLIELMEESGIDETLADFGEAETQIREMLADALAMKLVGRSWPKCGVLYNAAEKSDVNFSSELDAAAKEAGYMVR